MNIYEGGEVDLDAATHELKTSSSIVHEASRRAVVAEVTAAALLDIARSLRVVAADAAQGIATLFPTDEPAEEEAAERVLEEGDRVRLKDGTTGVVVGASESEDQPVVHVQTEHFGVLKVWLNLVAEVLPAEPAPAGEDHDEEEGDVKDDFDGQAPGLDALREIAAGTPKPKKKGGKK